MWASVRRLAGSKSVPPLGYGCLGWTSSSLKPLALTSSPSRGARQRRDHEVTEPLGVQHRRPVGLVLVHDERQRRHVGVAPPERLRHIDVQPVDLEESVLRREEHERAGPGVRLGLDVLPDAPL